MKFNKIRFFLRLIVSPFILGLLIVTFVYMAIKGWIYFLIHGGEFVYYEKGENSKTIHDVYELIKEQNKK